MKKFASCLILAAGFFLAVECMHGASATQFVAQLSNSVSPLPDPRNTVATNTGCPAGPWVQYINQALSTTTYIAPLVVDRSDLNATLQVTGCAPDQSQVNFNLIAGAHDAAPAGTVLANVYLQIPAPVAGTDAPIQSIVASVFTTGNGAGTYQIGEQVETQATTSQPMQTLDANSNVPYGTPYPSTQHPYPTTAPVIYAHYYPYDWTLNEAHQTYDTQYTTNVDMALPGILTGKFYFVNASNELAYQDITEYPNDWVKAELFLTTPLVLPTGDQGNTYVSLTGGGSTGSYSSTNNGGYVSFTLYASTSLKSIDDAKWNNSLPAAAVSGEQLLQLTYVPWGSTASLNSNGTGYGNAQDGPYFGIIDDNLTEAYYEELAQKLAGNVTAVIVRTLAPLAVLPSTPASCGSVPTVPCIFHAHGIKVYQYQFWGAVHFLDNSLTLPSGVLSGWILHETRPTSTSMTATPTGYTAPGTIEGNPSAGIGDKASWQILNVRLPAVQDYFVNLAIEDVQNGWDGIFYDGPNFWTDSFGRVGGDGSGCSTTSTSNPCVSFSWARAHLLQRITQAVHGIKSDAKVGMLTDANQYVDQTHAVDYVLKEWVNGGWLTVPFCSQANVCNPMNLTSGTSVMREKVECSPSLGWAETQAPYVQNNIFWGNKDLNPLLPVSSILWTPANTHGNFYTDNTWDSYYDNFDDFSTNLADILKYWDINTITGVSPSSSRLITTGPSLVEVTGSSGTSPQTTTITLSNPLPAVNLTTAQAMGNSISYILDPLDPKTNNTTNNLYVFAERPGDRTSCPSCWYSREYFAWFSKTTMLAGSIRFSQSPLVEGNATPVVPGATGTSIIIYGQAIAPTEQSDEYTNGLIPIDNLIPYLQSQPATATTFTAPLKLWSPNPPTAVWVGNNRLSSSCPNSAPSNCFQNNGMGTTWIYITSDNPINGTSYNPTNGTPASPPSGPPALKLEIIF